MTIKVVLILGIKHGPRDCQTKRLTKLFLAVEPKVSPNNDELRNKCNPEQWKRERTPFMWLSELLNEIGEVSSPCSPSLKSHCAASGKTVLGPSRLGAVARATMTQIDPII